MDLVFERSVFKPPLCIRPYKYSVGRGGFYTTHWNTELFEVLFSNGSMVQKQDGNFKILINDLLTSLVQWDCQELGLGSIS